MRLPVTGTGSSRSIPLLTVAVVMSSFSSPSLGGHQFAVVHPPVPLRVVLGEAVVNVAAARPILGLLLAQQRSVLHRSCPSDRAARIAAHMRPGIRVILL